MAEKAAKKLYNGERWRRKGIRLARRGKEGVFITQEIRVGLVSATLVISERQHYSDIWRICGVTRSIIELFWLRLGMCIDFSPWPNGGWAREDSVSCSSLSGPLVPNNSRTACSILGKLVCTLSSERSLQNEWYIPNIKNIMSNGCSWGWKIRFSKVRVICGASVGIIRAVLWLVALTT